MPNWSLYCCWICWSRSCSAWFTALSSCAIRLSPLPCGSALSSWVLSCLGISRSWSGVSSLTAYFGTSTMSPASTRPLGNKPSLNILHTYRVSVSLSTSQGNSRLPAQLLTQIFAFNATAPTLFFAPFRGYCSRTNMKRLIALAVAIFASQAVTTFGGEPVGSSTQVNPPPSFFRPNEFDTGAFGTFVTGLGSGANAGKLHAWGGRHGFHLLVPLEICRCQVPRDGSN